VEKTMKKHFYSYNDVHNAAMDIVLKMYKDNWRPDYVVGITRGGLPLALRISNLLDCRMETLKVKLRDGKPGEECESNCWMAEDAFGYVWKEDRDRVFGEVVSDPAKKKKILIVDDINDTGATFNWIKQDWQSGCLPDDPNWDTVWGGNVRFATMTENFSSQFPDVNYWWHEVNKSEENTWLVYPWEYD
jgi:hypoxanthine phosphoribosyltransferase